MNIISFLNLKGGVAKTVSAQNIAARLTALKNRVLVVDFDPQGDLSYTVLDREEVRNTVADMVKGTPIEECIISTPEFDIVPTWDECGLTNIVGSIKEEDRLYILSDALEDLQGYDYVIIDCPPTEGTLPLNALAASNYVFLPTVPEDTPVKQTENTVHLINKLIRRGSKIKIGGIFGTMTDMKLLAHKDNMEFLKENYGEYLMKTHIPNNVRLTELSRVKSSIFKYSPRSRGAVAYKKLVDEILEVVNEA